MVAAQTLLQAKLNLDAQYVGGYTVECSLKALILFKTPDIEKATVLMKISSGAVMHRPEILLGKLRDLGVLLPPRIDKRVGRMDWTTDLRYETGRRNTGETIAFLKTAKAIYEWVEDQLP